MPAAVSTRESKLPCATRTPPTEAATFLIPATLPLMIVYASSSEHYKRRADECRAIAEQSRDERERAGMLQMAAHWECLAEHRAKQEATN